MDILGLAIFAQGFVVGIHVPHVGTLCQVGFPTQMLHCAAVCPDILRGYD